MTIKEAHAKAIDYVMGGFSDLYPSELAVEIYSKYHAIKFSEFKAAYLKIERMNMSNYVDKYGLVTWIETSDDIIWEAYKKGEMIKAWYEKE